MSAFHRGGDGEPLVLLHGITDTWRTWELILDELERHHDVFAPTLLGHSGGPPLTNGDVRPEHIADQVERDMDAAGFETAHVAGNSLGGWLALELAARGRARSVVAFAPAGGWERGTEQEKATFDYFARSREILPWAAEHADTIAATPERRAQAMAYICTRPENVPADLVAHQIRGAADCAAVGPLLALAADEGHEPPELGEIDVPLRIVWGTEDRILPWPDAAVRFRDLLPDAEWIELDGIGHLPQFDDPEGTARLILEVSRP